MTNQRKLLRDEIERLGPTGGEPSALGNILKRVAFTPAQLMDAIESYGGSVNAYVRQRLAFQCIEVFKRGGRALSLMAALKMFRLCQTHDNPETLDQLMECAVWGIRFGAELKENEADLLAAVAIDALNHPKPYVVLGSFYLLVALSEVVPDALPRRKAALNAALKSAYEVLVGLATTSGVENDRINTYQALISWSESK